MRCQACGKDNSDHFKFCLSCGETLDAPAPVPKTESRYTLPKANQLTALLAEADDYERFEMLDEAITCIRRATALAPKRGDLKDRLQTLQARKRVKG